MIPDIDKMPVFGMIYLHEWSDQPVIHITVYIFPAQLIGGINTFIVCRESINVKIIPEISYQRYWIVCQISITVFMYDAILATAGARAPVVMINVNRETPGIIAVSSGQQDMISTRDAGWIFLIAEDCQEVLDLVIQAYRLAEDYDIQVPVMVHYDGFYLSYLSEGVDVPYQEDVDQ